MCIIATAAKKRHITKEEVISCMTSNPSGFFMAALRPDGTRTSIRTLDKDIALKFFDESVKEEDAFVLHARIPSVGPLNLENVHGWECDNIMFAHNMTIHEVKKMIDRVKWPGTDSEFFFKKIFIPYYRGLGAEAYKDGKFHPDLDNLIQYFLGSYNKFCFIMPDNKIIRYGDWLSEPTRKEGEEVAFYASNGGYKTYKYSSQKGGTAAGVAGFPEDDDYDYDPDGYLASYYRGGYGYRKPQRSKEKESRATIPEKWYEKKETKCTGEVLFKLAGVKDLCKLALTHLVFDNVLTCRYLYAEDESEKAATKFLKDTLPAWFCPITLSALNSLLCNMANAIVTAADANTAEEKVKEFASKVAAIYESPILKSKFPGAVVTTEWNLSQGYKTVQPTVDAFCRVANIALRFEDCDARALAAAYVLGKNQLDEPDMVQIDNADIAAIDTLTPEVSDELIQILLCVINDELIDYYGTAEDLTGFEDDLPFSNDPEKQEFGDASKNVVKNEHTETNTTISKNDREADLLKNAVVLPETSEREE